MSKYYRSRLEKTESKRFAKQAMILGIATIVLLGILIIIGIPALTKLAVYFSGSRDESDTDLVDTLAPLSPQVNSFPEATNSAKVSLSGYAESGSEVILKKDDVAIQKSIVDASGSFSFSSVQLEKGVNEFRLTAVDSTGNESPSTPVLNIDYDNEKPKLSISNPKEGSKFFGSTERLVSISGETEPNAQVTLNKRSLVVDSNGGFATSHELNEGDNQLEIIATDSAGNSSTMVIKVSYQP